MPRAERLRSCIGPAGLAPGRPVAGRRWRSQRPFRCRARDITRRSTRTLTFQSTRLDCRRLSLRGRLAIFVTGHGRRYRSSVDWESVLPAACWQGSRSDRQAVCPAAGCRPPTASCCSSVRCASPPLGGRTSASPSRTPACGDSTRRVPEGFASGSEPGTHRQCLMRPPDCQG